MMKYAQWILSHGYNIEKRRGGWNVKIGGWKTRFQRNRIFLGGVSQLLLTIIVANHWQCGSLLCNSVVSLYKWFQKTTTKFLLNYSSCSSCCGERPGCPTNFAKSHRSTWTSHHWCHWTGWVSKQNSAVILNSLDVPPELLGECMNIKAIAIIKMVTNGVIDN